MNRLVVVAAVVIGGPIAVVVALVVILGSTGALRAFRVPSESNLPALRIGDRVLASALSTPGRGDVAVLKPPAGIYGETCGVAPAAGQPCPRPTPELAPVSVVVRVVAEGGDRVAVRGGRLVLNGRPQPEPYARTVGSSPLAELPREARVPAGHVFVMGDNRSASVDSRVYGPVPQSAVVGRVEVRYWPPSVAGPL